MLVVVSPAKKLDFESEIPSFKTTQPKFLDKSSKLIEKLRSTSAKEISKLMKLSEALTELNISRYKTFHTPFNDKNARAALYAFMGDTYVGLDARSMSKDAVSYAKKHFRILSGLYGLLGPLDLIQPYRLEMGTRFSCDGAKNLYEYWRNDLTSELNRALKGQEFLINCASTEYSSAIDFSKIEASVITPVFKEKKNDDYKVVGLFAKRARGMMARYIVENQITTLAQLKKFAQDGYSFRSDLSKDGELVFTRG